MTNESVSLRRENEEFWRRLADGRLAVQRCMGCESVRFPPTAACPGCGDAEADWFEPDAVPRLAAWTISLPEAPGIPSRLQDWLPYALALLRWEDAPGLLVPVRVEPKGSEFDAAGLRLGAAMVLDPDYASQGQLVGRVA